MSELRTDSALLKALEQAANAAQTAEEKRRQRISFVMSTLGSGSTITRARVEEELDKLEGKAA